MNKILELRTKLQMTQDEFAEYCGISRISIARYEAGTKISSANAKKICKACGVSLDYLYEDGSDDEYDDYVELESACVEPSTPEEYRLLSGFRSLNEAGRQFILQTLDTAVASNIYKQGDLSLGKEAE